VIVAGIPAYNEEKTIAKVILLAQRHVDVVVVCDDGSQDMTADIAQKLGAIVIRRSKNMGYGASIRALFEKAQALNADLLLTLDADGQHDPREVPRLIQPIVEGKADIVIGSRFLNKAHGMPLYRRIGVKALTKMTDGSKGKGNLTDGQCGFRAYNRKAMDGLAVNEDGMGASAEVLMKARTLGLVVTEVPVEVRYKGLETSTHNPLRHGWDVIATIIRLVVEERPLYYLGLPGALLLIVGMGFGVWTLQLRATTGYIVTNVALATIAFAMIGIFCLFTAITLYAISRAIERNKATTNDEQ
jgi:glycosyltransferase involved in cell wall biosynthesis